MPAIHLPIQSGSNKILKSMNRNHTAEDYIELISKIKKANPLIKFSSDFIIGYPGENEQDFEASLKLLKKVGFINTYSYIFSPRPGTPASKLKMIDEKVAKKRLTIFQKLADEIKLKFRKSLLGKKSLVLFENKLQGKDEYFGRDEFFNSFVVKSNENLKGKIKEVKILNGSLNTLHGEITLSSNNSSRAA